MEVLSIHGSIGKKVNPLVSVVIPVKNGEPWLREVMQRYRSQTVADKMEIVVIDSGSSDDSIGICKQFGATVHEIDPGSFNHGLTRNLGVQFSKGEFILMTVQDALPANEHFLEELLGVFSESEAVAVCGLQVVPSNGDTNPFVWHKPIDVPQVSVYQFPQAAAFDGLSPAEKRDVCRWDDVCAMYRRDIITKFRFPPIAFGEDMAWCKEVLRAGYKIAYQPKANVFHYHDDTGQVL